MSFDTALLDILCCPVTRLPLERLPGDRLESLNALIGQGEVKNHGGQVLTKRLAEVLVTRDGKLAYPVRDGIPVLLEDDGIELLNLEM